MDAFIDVSTVVFYPSGSTRPIAMRRGVKQGDSLSPGLFNMVMDELLEDLHSKPPGISIDGLEISALAYPDDIVLFNQDVHSA